MYNQSFNRRNNSRPRFNGGRHKQKYIDPALFVNKAQVVEVENAPVIVHNFPDFPISMQLKNNISAKGFTTPTPIQDQVIPHILAGKDVIGIANTGTGKTGAFLIPLLNKIAQNPSQRVLIIAPTRELAMQIQDECKEFARGMNIFSVITIGGASMNNQIANLKRNPHIVIGTPGRLKDLAENRKLNLALFNNVVLDEVDRMMDMGFINDIRLLINKLPLVRQSLFFSATVPQEIVGIMQTFLKDPVTVSVKTHDTAQTVEQDVVKVGGRNKIDVLHDLLATDGFNKVIIFGRTKRGVDKLSKALLQRGFKVAAIHGNKSQGQRQRALDEFKSGKTPILLATDVASRGLDIEDVSHVINYEQPESYEDYVHRIGRTGRAEKKGIALTFVD